jgi:hypothetical protein
MSKVEAHGQEAEVKMSQARDDFRRKAEMGERRKVEAHGQEAEGKKRCKR